MLDAPRPRPGPDGSKGSQLNEPKERRPGAPGAPAARARRSLGAARPGHALAIVLIVALDQITKQAILRNLEYRDRVNVIPGFFDLVYFRNTGAAFSFLDNQAGWQNAFFACFAFAVCGALVWLAAKRRIVGAEVWAATLIVAGALGNVVDRLLHGFVVDFLSFYLGGRHFPAFNVADSAITLGAGLLLLLSLKAGRGEAARPGGDEGADGPKEAPKQAGPAGSGEQGGTGAKAAGAARPDGKAHG